MYNIVDAYNKAEVQKAKKEHRKAELLPKVSAHVMRHTACTRMAECRMDIKVLQYIMGHAHFDVTMEVYNHLGDRARIENEIAKLDSMAVNFWHQKRKNWCQIGVKPKKNDNFKIGKCLQTIDFTGFAKKY